MEKHLSAVGYWLGLGCTVLALIFRMLTVFNINTPQLGASGGNGIGYLSFLHGAGLFFLLSLTSWTRTARS